MQILSKVNFSNRVVVLTSLCTLAILLAAASEPLDHMHWDVPIYLYQAKRFAETHYLINYIRHAKDIAMQLNGNWPTNEMYSEAYWRFTRLGHIAILGIIVDLFGNNFSAIIVMTWLYTVFLIAGLVVIFLATVQIGNKTEPQYPWVAGSGLSMLLFLLSDIYRYLAGNLVSEVPSLLLLSIAIFSLLKAIDTKQLVYATLSGFLIFLAYTMRMESVWPWLTFIVVYMVTRGAGTYSSVSWHTMLVAGLTAVGCYVIYAVIFSPLAYPTQGIAFIESVTESYGTKKTVTSYKSMFVIGGFLWFGALFSLTRLRQSRLLHLGWLWLLMCTLPLIPTIFWGTVSQTRMFISLIPPLFLLSAGGWAILIRNGLWRPQSVSLVSLVCCLFLLSDSTSYPLLKNKIPGVWRLENVRTFLVVPISERVNYVPQEMALLSKSIYTDIPTVLIYTQEFIQEYINLILFFGSSYAADSDLALAGDPAKFKKCEEYSPSPNDPVQICKGYTDSAPLKTDMMRYRIMTLQTKHSLVCSKEANFSSDNSYCNLLLQQGYFTSYKETARLSLFRFSPKN